MSVKRTWIRFLLTIPLALSGAQGVVSQHPKQRPLPPEEIIKHFASNESRLEEEFQNFLFRRDVLLQMMGPDGSVTGEFHRVSETFLNQYGQREERVLSFPQPTLRGIQITERDLADLTGIQPFALGAGVLPKYSISYKGREHIDGIDSYVFDVRPRKPPDSTRLHDRYFEGRIWIDAVDLIIVKLAGHSLPEDAQNKFPHFETLRGNIEYGIRFPIYIHADDVLRFQNNTVHIRLRVRYTDFKRFRGKAEVNNNVIKAKPSSTPNRATDRGKTTGEQARPSLSLDQIRELIPIAPDSLIAGQIRKRGIRFTPTNEIIDELKQLGAKPHTIEALRSLVSNSPPYVVLSVNKTEIQRGRSLLLVAEASDPDNDKLEYHWSTTAGRTEGEGRVVTLETSEISMSSTSLQVTVTVDVSDGKGGTDSDSKSVIVRAHSSSGSDQAMSITARPDGKYIMVSLAGRLGEATSLKGSIEVQVNMNTNSNNGTRVEGSLPGVPCSVNLIPHENVVMYSFREPPGIVNKWGRVRVRIRPKDPDQVIRFAINWRIIQDPPRQ